MSCGKNCNCGCCDGTKAVTPAPIYNRPGLDALTYRIGEHGSFFETMRARLSSTDFPALKGFGARTTDDPSIALMDGWSTVADVLTFYQERLANEGYLRTATERRSVLEMSRLIGYAPRPGVAATVYLSFDIDQNADQPVDIPTGSRVQSLPGPGETAQSFETIEDFTARREWDAIAPRMQRPNSILRMFIGTDESPGARVYLQGTSTGLKANDALLIQLFDGAPLMYRVSDVIPDSTANSTQVRFRNWDGSEIQPPTTTMVSRALLAFQQTVSGVNSPQSISQQILVAIGTFLEWLSDQSMASPLDTSVAQFLGDPKLVVKILLEVDTLQQAAASGISDATLAGDLKVAIRDIGAFSGCEGVTGIVATATQTLAASLSAIDVKKPNIQPKEDLVISGLLKQIVARLDLARSVPPRNSQSLVRDPATLFDPNSDVGAQAVAALAPAVATELANAIRNAKVSSDVPITIYAMRKKSLLFGSTASPKITGVNRDTGVASFQEWSDTDIHAAERQDTVYLDTPQETIQPGTWLVLDYSSVNTGVLGAISLPTLTQNSLLIARTGAISSKLARAVYNVSGQTTQIGLINADNQFTANWFSYDQSAATSLSSSTAAPPAAFTLIRHTVVYAQSEELPLAMEPIEDDICGGDQWIETDGLYTGLDTGRWLVVSGERADVAGTDGVSGSELVMLDAVQQYVQKTDLTALGALGQTAAAQLLTFEPGETLHTYLKLATPLAYCYQRGTVTINANVVKATHGETRNETLGSGDASATLQTFALKQSPLTFVPANVPQGVTSTLQVFVNGVQWQEAEALIAMGPIDRDFLTQIADDGTVSVIFGNGKSGARVPTGVANITAIYRNGIGQPGNVRAGQISQLLSRPLGVKGVNNPQEASGGADPETRDQARKNAPLAVMSLDRLVSVGDYADFTRTFAGIAKAVSARVQSGGGDGVYVTVAGLNDIPIPTSSDLYANLLDALRTYGDPSLPVRVQWRQLLMLVLSAGIAIDSDYQWVDVVGRVRAALLDRYSFENQDLGQSVVLSEAIALIQNQPGVLYVEVAALGAVSQVNGDGTLRSPQEISTALKNVTNPLVKRKRPRPFVPVAGIVAGKNAVLPAQLAFFVPTLPETLILNQIDN